MYKKVVFNKKTGATCMTALPTEDDEIRVFKMAATHHVVTMQMRFMTKPANIMSRNRKLAFEGGDSHTNWNFRVWVLKLRKIMTNTTKGKIIPSCTSSLTK